MRTPPQQAPVVAFDYDAMLKRLQKALPGVAWQPVQNRKGVTAELPASLRINNTLNSILVVAGDRPGKVHVYALPRLSRINVAPKTATELLVNVVRSHLKEAEQAQQDLKAMLTGVVNEPAA